MLSCTRKFLSVGNYSVSRVLNYSTGHIKDLGGKWAQMEQSQETGYFQRKDKENIEYLKKKLKDGKKIEDIIDNSKKEVNKKNDDEKKDSILERWT